jgi:hypothetical protein
MAGLMAYAAAGALGGFGEGLEQRALMKLKESYQAQDREQRLHDQKEMVDYREGVRADREAAKGSGSGGGGSGGGSRRSGGSGSAAPASAAGEGGEKLYGETLGEDGILYGRNRTGQMKPYLDASGKPFKPGAKSDDKKDDADSSEPSDVAPEVLSTAPSSPQPPAGATPPVGTVRNGYRFKGGDPTKRENWEETGSVVK